MSTPPTVLCAWSERHIMADNQQQIVEMTPVMIGGDAVSPLCAMGFTPRYDAWAVMMVPVGNGQVQPHRFRFTLHDVTTIKSAFEQLHIQAQRGAREEQQKMRAAMVGLQ